MIENKKAIVLLNKIDEKDIHLENTDEMKQIHKPIIKISAKTQEGLEQLYEQILSLFQLSEIELDSGDVITNIRHKNQIRKAIDDLENAKQGIKENMPVDIIAVAIKQSLEDLSSITGENVSEDIIQEIFSKFCLGK